LIEKNDNIAKMRNMKNIFMNYNLKIKTFDSIKNFVKNDDGSWNNLENNAIYLSPFFKFNGDDIYAFLTTYNLHSCLFINFNKKEELIIKYHEVINEVKIYDYSSNQIINYSFKDNEFRFSVNECGNVTLFFNNNLNEPLTIFIKDNYRLKKDNKDIRVITEEISDLGNININENETLLIKKGMYQVDTITFNGNNSSLLFEDGVILKAKAPNDNKEKYLEIDWANEKRYRPFITNENANNNISIIGNAIFDLSSLPFHSRDTIFFHDISKLKIYGITTINPCCWTYFIFRCKKVNIRNAAVFGYRQNSDAFIISDSQDVHVTDSFARSGDDLFEIKTLDSEEAKFLCKNIYFSRCFAWPDKTRGIGIIDETKQSIKNVYFDSIIVYGASAYWQDALGSIIVLSNNTNNKKIHINNINFNNIKVYNNQFYPINITNVNGGVINNINFSNIYYENTYPIRINRFMGAGKIDNISFNNIEVENHIKMDNDKFIVSNNGKFKIKLNGNEITFKK